MEETDGGIAAVVAAVNEEYSIFFFSLEILIRKSLDRPNVIPTDSLHVVLTRLAQKEMRSTSTETTIPTTAPFEGARVSFSLGIGAPKRLPTSPPAYKMHRKSPRPTSHSFSYILPIQIIVQRHSSLPLV
jgi:ubiquitin-protein ligase